MRKPGVVPLVFALLFAPVGLFLFATAAADLVRTRLFVARAARAEGVVVAVSAASRFNDLERVRFTVEGREHEFDAAPARLAYAVGARVPVLYDPADPHRAEIDRYEELYHEPLVRGAIGALFSLFGLGMLAGAIAARRRRTPSDGTDMKGSFTSVR
jgi:hypothetical protein